MERSHERRMYEGAARRRWPDEGRAPPRSAYRRSACGRGRAAVLWLGAAALALGGCAAADMGLASKIPIAATSLTEAGRGRTPEGRQLVAFLTVDEASGAAAPGARCEAASRDVTARFVAPARLDVPLFGADTAPLLVVCKHPQFGRAQISASIAREEAKDAPAAPADAGFGGELLALLGAADAFLSGREPERAASTSAAVSTAAPAYRPEYRLALSLRGGETAAAPPKPTSVEARSLAPVPGLGAAQAAAAEASGP